MRAFTYLILFPALWFSGCASNTETAPPLSLRIREDFSGKKVVLSRENNKERFYVVLNNEFKKKPGGLVGEKILLPHPKYNGYLFSTILIDVAGNEITPSRPLTYIAPDYLKPYCVFSEFNFEGYVFEMNVLREDAEDCLSVEIGWDFYYDLKPGTYRLRVSFFTREDDYDGPLTSVRDKFVGEIWAAEEILLEVKHP